MLNFPISTTGTGDYILKCFISECKRTAAEARQVAKSLTEMANLAALKLAMEKINDMAKPLEDYTKKRVCFKCDTLVEEYYICEKCGFMFCGDHIIQDSDKPEEVKRICENCLNERK